MSPCSLSVAVHSPFPSAANILLKKPDSCTHKSIFTCDCTPHWEVRVADFDSIAQVSVLRYRAMARGKGSKDGKGQFLKVGVTGTSGYRAPEVCGGDCLYIYVYKCMLCAYVDMYLKVTIICGY